jgi:putative ABC transport system ATP-binding protein
MLSGVRKTLDGRERSFVLDVPRLHIPHGALVALTAPSGRGKSTLINLLSLAIPPDPRAGSFRLGVEDVSAHWAAGRHDRLAALRARHFGYVVQTGGLLPFLSARENIRLAQQIAGRVDDAFVDSVAAALGIEAQLAERPGRLSVGERQRVSIARAVAHRPGVVVADEPTAALDPANKHAVIRLLLDMRAEHGFTLVIASHDLEALDTFDLPRCTPAIHTEAHRTVAIVDYDAAGTDAPALA